MAPNKTLPTRASPVTFINNIADPTQRKDARDLAKMMRAITRRPARMWGTGITGFGQYHYRYASGREGDWFLTGFSPGKRNMTIYIMPGFGSYQTLMDKLGKHKTGKSCLYIKTLNDIDREVLHSLIEQSVKEMRLRYETD